MHEMEKAAVLLVEDNKLAQKIGIIVLEECNCQVDAVASGELALQYAEKKSYQLIFMDIGLPDMDGLTAVQEIKKTQLNKNVPIVVLTAHSDKEYMAQSFEAGVAEYLVKPLQDKVARNLLDKYLV